jgi:methanogenic corrinoid protein MtbC1
MPTRAFEAAMTVLRSVLNWKEGTVASTVNLGGYEGSIHAIGKNLVKTVLEAAGFHVIELGTGAAAARQPHRESQTVSFRIGMLYY